MTIQGIVPVIIPPVMRYSPGSTVPRGMNTTSSPLPCMDTSCAPAGVSTTLQAGQARRRVAVDRMRQGQQGRWVASVESTCRLTK